MSTVKELQERLALIAPRLGIEDARGRLASLQEKSEASDLWENQEEAVAVMAQLNESRELVARFDELEEFLSLGEGMGEGELAQLEVGILALERQALLAGVNDRRSAIITVHAGTGGADAQDWAEILERMFLRYVEQGATEQIQDRTFSLDRSAWKSEILDLVRGEEAGIRKAVIEVRGAYAYGLLKAEAGVHRLVRLSPFNSKNLRQTSFALVEVMPEVETSDHAGISDKDLRIDVFRAGGHGGQGVNTTDSAVRITHIPSGLVVSVQNERSQHQNKATAMKILQSRLNRLLELKNAEEAAILRGEFKEGSWGNQIRSYVMQPYQLVKDHRTGQENANISAVLDGQIGKFIEAYLLKAE